MSRQVFLRDQRDISFFSAISRGKRYMTAAKIFLSPSCVVVIFYISLCYISDKQRLLKRSFLNKHSLISVVISVSNPQKLHVMAFLCWNITFVVNSILRISMSLFSSLVTLILWPYVLETYVLGFQCCGFMVSVSRCHGFMVMLQYMYPCGLVFVRYIMLY